MATERSPRTSRKDRETAQANVERVITLRKAGNGNSADELAEETRALIETFGTRARVDLSAALNKALKTPLGDSSADVVTFSSVDYRTVFKDAQAVLEDTSAGLRKAIDADDRAADVYWELAKVVFDRYHELSYNGEPDMLCNSQAARDFASDTQAEAREQYMRDLGLSEEDARVRVDAAWLRVKRRLSDYRAYYIHSLDDDPDRFRELYPAAAEKYPDHRPAEAMSKHFGIDPLGFTEQNNRRSRIRRLAKKAENTPAGPARDEILQQIREIEESLGKTPKAVDPVKETRRVNRAIGTAANELDPETVKHLPDSEKRIIAETYPTLISKLTQVFTAATETPKE